MTDSKIIEQIRQLLRIASDRGASINERELAQRRAERLMVRYRIESLPEGDARAKDEDITSMEVEIKGGSASMARAIVDGLATREETTSTGQDLVLASRYQRAEAKACEGRNMRYARGLMIDRDGEASGERDGYASGIGWMGERLDGPRVGIAAS